MRKVILASFAVLCSVAVFGQKNYDLTIQFTLDDSTQNAAAKPDIKQVVAGSVYGLECRITNNGPDNFKGGPVNFNCAIANDPGGSFPQSDTTFSINLPEIDRRGTASFGISFRISTNKYTKADGMNIVIVWPTDSKIDRDSSNNSSEMQVWLKDAPKNSVGIAKETHTTAHFNVYPNPAGSELSVNLDASVKQGTLSLTDMTGKVITAYTINTLSNTTYQLPLVSNGGAPLAKGVYLLKLESSQYHEVSRIVVGE
jgi:hypothetical protein